VSNLMVITCSRFCLNRERGGRDARKARRRVERIVSFGVCGWLRGQKW